MGASRTVEPTPSARRVLVLGRSPFEPAVMAWGVLAGLLLAAVGVAVGWPLTEATPVPADLDGLDRVDVTDSDGLVTAARVTSQVGHLAVVAPVAVLVGLLARWRWRTWDLALLLFVVISGSQAATAVVKFLTSRDRPDEALVGTLSSAFPSGHAVRAVTVYGLIAWLVWLMVRPVGVRLLLAAGAVVLILASALARVALVAHWPTDVIGGVVLGAVWLVISLVLVRPRLAPAPPADRVGDPPASTGTTDGAPRTG
jgi:undecaprenyl-diphosphatase